MSSGIDHLRFFLSWLRAPRTVASAIPSSRALARRMAAAIPKDDDRLVIELGGGTGSITRVLLDSGVEPERLVVLEQQNDFAELLKRKFPGISVLNEDAQGLREALKKANFHQPVGCIVSGLPLLTLPAAVCGKIISECAQLLPDDGQFLQFTYGYRSPVPLDLARSERLQGEPIGSVWTNIPPATVWSYRPRRGVSEEGVGSVSNSQEIENASSSATSSSTTSSSAASSVD